MNIGSPRRSRRRRRSWKESAFATRHASQGGYHPGEALACQLATKPVDGRPNVTAMSVLHFALRGKLPVIQQTEAAECGLACLAIVASFHGHRIDLNTLRRRHPVSLNGVTLRALMQVASSMNLACRPLRLDLTDLRQLRLPAILHWDMNHYVVLKSVSRKAIVIHDPAWGERSFPLSEASRHLTGVALELTPAEGFIAQDERARLPLS